ncbi:MAG: 50S ribosomal protein L18 [Rickettsiales bacterium]|jgi:large subunit ribosomal protein L18|nr:50S ribosomal protein L18 [Rickettsiales bacterium]
MSSRLDKNSRKIRLSSRVRYKLRKRRNDRARLSVFCSNGHVYAQIIDDSKGVTLAAASTRSVELKDLVKKSTVESAAKVGRLIAQKAQKAGVKDVVFDRGDKLYHGKVQALADAAREVLSF